MDNNHNFTIALPKGRILDVVLPILKRVGIEPEKSFFDEKLWKSHEFDDRTQWNQTFWNQSTVKSNNKGVAITIATVTPAPGTTPVIIPAMIPIETANSSSISYYKHFCYC